MTWQSASYGVLGSRPSAAALPDAYEYFATDDSGGTLYRVQGGAWVKVAPGAGATTADIPDSSNKRYVTDAELTVLAATSGTNTGDQTVPAFATNAVLLGSAAAAGAAGTVMRSNDTIAAFDATAPTTQAFGDAAAVGTAAFAARRDHKHAMPSLPVGGSVLLFDFEITGSDQAAIDTNVDGAYAGAISGAYFLLEVWFYGRTDNAAALGGASITFNNDTAANYDRSQVRTINATVSGVATNAASSFAVDVTGSGATASVFTTQRITIPNYAGTVGFKSGEANGGLPDETAANMRAVLQQFQWRSTAAITRVAFTSTTGGSKFKVGSRLLIYGR